MAEFVSAAELALDLEMARQYVARRQDAAENFLRGLEWSSRDGFTVKATIWIGTDWHEIVHELRPSSLHASACWGELFWNPKSKMADRDPVMFPAFENFVAFCLATKF